MGNACFHRNKVTNKKAVDNEETSARRETNDYVNEKPKEEYGDSKKFIPFLNSSWPGSILEWTQEDLESFAECFTPHLVKVGEEVSIDSLILS